MTEALREVLAAHARRYPLMEPTDAVKLIYQNEFGVGHLIPDAEIFRQRLADELRAFTPGNGPEIVPIGGGLVRVDLRAVLSGTISADELTDACVKTAAEHHGDAVRFAEKLRVLEACCAEGLFAFDSAELTEYLVNYRAEDCPPVSHSPRYRAAYAPAYRVCGLVSNLTAAV